MSKVPNADSQRVLLVCKGNICRSAAAQAVMTALSGGTLPVRSRGTRGWHEGKGASAMMRSIAIERGYDMEAHVAHQLTEQDMRWATHILAFDQETISSIKQKFPGSVDARLRLFSVDGCDILDPYGQNESVFQDCFDQIEAGVKQLLQTMSAAPISAPR